MYRAIIFSKLVPSFLLSVSGQDTISQREDVSPGLAMKKAIEVLSHNSSHRAVELTTYQPYSGIIYVDGKACGTVFKI